MELIVPLLLPPSLEKISASILDCHINPDILSLSTISKNSFTLDFNPDIPSSPLNWGGGSSLYSSFNLGISYCCDYSPITCSRVVLQM